MKAQEHLHLAALLHDIGKFRQRATDRYKTHQEHSYEFVTEDFADFFAPCGNTFKNAIRHHHRNPTRLQHLIEKQVILADRLSATEREDEERESEDFVESALVSPLSRLKGATKDQRYPLIALNLDRDTVIPRETPDINRDTYEKLWKDFKKTFGKAMEGKHYTSAFYQTIVALLHKYTAQIPSATPWEKRKERTVPDISLYAHLRTTAAIAACIGRELSETEIDTLLTDAKDSHKKICALIKGDISGIQNFLYHVLSDGAANQLRGRSFYLQLLTESIAHYVLKQFDLPITNLLLASGGHFYILAPDTDAKAKLDTIRQNISKKLWELHRGDLSCILAGISINTRDFGPKNFSDKWKDVSENVQERKRSKWVELGAQDMFGNLFEPHEEPHQERENHWKFEELGKKIRRPKYLVTFKVSESPIPEKPEWSAALKAFGMDIRLCEKMDDRVEKPEHAENAVVYRLGNTDFLTDQELEHFQWESCSVSYDFQIFRPVIAHRHDTDDEEKIADYDYLANASEGVQWLGALRMDVDDLGKVFSKEKLGNATISRLTTLSEAFRLFFEGYVPQLCRDYNTQREEQILELIYAGGDDLFLVGGWSALPEIAQKIRSAFRHFITGDHVTLSGGIAIEHKKFPLYQFAARSGSAEGAAKGLDKKNAITFLQKPMKWEKFAEACEWHQRFLDVLTGQDQLPRDILTRLSQIYSERELEGHQWAWRSLYYFHRLQERYKYDNQKAFLYKLKHELNHQESSQFREELIHVITRWTALRIRDS
ncbi:type III-A CRISPR-associated protein Cas10/Csm1 [Candidatus Poribacteria bacterium]|nr:MAG: type III-A CRISPR-associated protein Cas10/Csm1 [Candidatus Poribacteria bacterium]